MSKTRRKPKTHTVSSPSPRPSSATQAITRLPNVGPTDSQTAQEAAIVALVKAMLTVLNFFRLVRCGFPCRHDAVSAYVQDLRRLLRLQRELCELLLAALSANVVARSEGSNQHEAQLEQAVVQKICELLQEVPFRAESIASRLEVELTEKPLGQLVAVLRDDLERGLVSIAARFVKALETAVDRQLLGRIQWVGRSGCKLLFFKDVIIQTGVTSTEPVRSHVVRVLPDSGFLEEEYHRHIQGVHEYRKAFHSYQLMDAKRYQFPGPDVPLPYQVRGLLDSTALWLRPLIQYVSGTQIRARVLERDTVQKEWTETEVERVTYKGDPAITIFDYILTGWADAEQKAAVRQQPLANHRPHSEQGFFQRLLGGK